MGSLIKMYAAFSGGSQPAAAQIDCPMPGRILSVQWAISGSLAGLDYFASAQLSFRSAAAFSTNDDRGIISEVTGQSDLTTSGTALLSICPQYVVPELMTMGGERIYLHLTSTASFVGVCGCLIGFDFDLDKVSTRRR